MPVGPTKRLLAGSVSRLVAGCWFPRGSTVLAEMANFVAIEAILLRIALLLVGCRAVLSAVGA